MKTLLSLGLALYSATSLAATPATLYECSGGGVTVDYTTTSLTGSPMLTITIGRKTFTGNGAEITEEVTVLGRLLTITQAAAPDLSTDTLTLLLPDVNVIDFGASEKFDTRVFTTRTQTSIGGPQLVDGVVQNNASRLVHCTGTAAVF
ncbi:MAG: hypothetical protein ABL925_06180 [Methylococcales bacterium]